MKDLKTYPYRCCALCRDGTPATVAFRTFEEEAWSETAYCDPCAEAMTSVLRDAGRPDPTRRALAPVTLPVAVKKEDPPPPPKKKARWEGEGIDLLAVLGVRRE